MTKYKVLSFYNFLEIDSPRNVQLLLADFFNNTSIKGTILVAKEGVNGTISGINSEIKNFSDLCFKNNLLSKEMLKFSECDFLPFHRLKIKLKDEIVTIGNHEINVQSHNGEHVNPKDWNNLITQEDILLLDTRNVYETHIGTFKNSISPKTTNFREFPKWVKKLKSKIDTDQKVAMFCTGGIRCEKASSLMKKEGFKNVYQLKGGILNYFADVNENDSMWEGECFVFDDRVSLDHNLAKGSYDLCHGCRMPINSSDKKSKQYVRGVSCPHCYNVKSSSQKEKYANRQKQVDIANATGKTHFGNATKVIG